MNLEICIIIIILYILVYKVYEYYYSKGTKRTGKWIQLDGEDNFTDIPGIDWDVSERSQVFVPTFRKGAHFKNTLNTTHTLKDEQTIEMLFVPEDTDYKDDFEWLLYVYDEDFHLISEYLNPINIFFTSKETNIKHIQKLEPNRKYHFFLRKNIFNNSEDNYLDMYLMKYSHFDNIINLKTRQLTKPQKLTTDEREVREELNNVKKRIIREMKRKNYILSEEIKSVKYNSFPNNGVSHYLLSEVNSNEVLILLCTNKKKTLGIKKHNIEINNELDNLFWEPENNSHISHLIIENEEDLEITFYERLIDVHPDSFILPFRLLKFVKK